MLAVVALLVGTVILLSIALPLVLWVCSRLCWPESPRAQGSNVRRCMVVLGSGGHTTEMLYDLGTVLDQAGPLELVYVLADTDRGSLDHVDALHRARHLPAPLVIARVPRAREVGQSYFTSLLSTAWAFLACLGHVFRAMPDVVLCNGPGTCVPIVVAAKIASLLNRRRISVVYCESLACVEHLSVSGRLVYCAADAFLVQWPQLLARYPAALCAGFAQQVAEGAAELKPLLAPMQAETPSREPPTAIVTVGSTKFEALIRKVDDPAFLRALRGLGIERLRVQVGSTAYRPKNLEGNREGVTVEVFDFSPTVPDELRKAALVVSHAGAGTILDCLRAGRRVVVVPNEVLMANHQVQLGMAMQELGFLACLKVADLVEGISGVNFEGMLAFPSEPSPVLAERVADLLGR